MKRRLPALALLFLAAAAGCAPKVTPAVAPPARSISLHKSVFINDIRLEMATLKNTFPRKEIVPLRFSVTNTGDKSAILTFPTAQIQEFTVADSTGREVWRWSTGRVFAQSEKEVTLEPGTAATYNYFGSVPAGRLAPGNYTVTGWLLAKELYGETIRLNITIK
jgi:hypothetical protein